MKPKRLTSGAGSDEGQNGQKQIGSSGKGPTSKNSTNASNPSGVDTTLQATMDMGGTMREPEDD
jgi:hypothetical protein